MGRSLFGQVCSRFHAPPFGSTRATVVKASLQIARPGKAQSATPRRTHGAIAAWDLARGAPERRRNRISAAKTEGTQAHPCARQMRYPGAQQFSARGILAGKIAGRRDAMSRDGLLDK